MPTKVELLLEAERRGLLPPDKVAALAEARKRGLIADPSSPAGTPPSAEWMANLQGPKPNESGLRDFLTGATGMVRGALNAVTPTDLPLSENVERMRDLKIAGVLGQPPTLSSLITGNRGLPEDKTKGYGDRLFHPEFADQDSGAYLAGALMDPAAWAIGSGGMKAGATVLKEAPQILQRALGGAAGGATIGGLSDDGSSGTGASIGAGIAAFAPPIIRGAINLPSYLKRLVNPSGAQLAARAAGDKFDDVVDALVATRSGTPGLELTAGQASVPSGSAEFAALQKLAQRETPSLYTGPTGAYDAQQAARQAAIKTVGGTTDDLTAAIGARKAAAKANYGKALEVEVKPDAELDAIRSHPFFDDASPIAKKLAKADKFDPETNLTAYLHYVKESLDDMIQSGKRGESAIGDSERRAIVGLKKDLVAWLAKRNPAYEAARAANEAASKPITQMKLGQELERSLVSPTGAETGGQFATAARKLETQISNRTGRPRIEELTPAQRQIVDAITKDVQRDTTWKRMASEGMKNLQDRVNPWKAPAPGAFAPFISAARSWFNSATGRLNDRGMTELSELMVRDPQKLAQMMLEFSPAKRKVVQAVIDNYTGPAVGGLVSGVEQ